MIVRKGLGTIDLVPRLLLAFPPNIIDAVNTALQPWHELSV
jgi:hypothetical protein